jgi:hypothetical protein
VVKYSDRNGGSISGKETIFFSYLYRPDGLRELISPGLKRSGREAHYLPSCNIEVKNGGAMPASFCTSLWPIV